MTAERSEQRARARADRAVRRAQEERERERAAREARRAEQEAARIARRQEAEKSLTPRQRRQSKNALRRQQKIAQRQGGQTRLAVARPVDPTLRYKGLLRPAPPPNKPVAGSLGDATNDIDMDEHLKRSLQELRTRAEPPPLSAFGNATPRAPSTHAPRLPAFEKLVSPRVLNGVGGFISAGTTGAWSARVSSKKAAKAPAATTAGTAPSTFARGRVRFTPRQKIHDRPAEGFTRSWAPAHIDISPASIKKIADADNAKRSLDELRYVFEMIDSNSLDGIIDKADLDVILERLGYTPEPGEVEDILWEVDDDRDGGLSWEEFSSLCVVRTCAQSCQQTLRHDFAYITSADRYDRVRNDTDGLEPHRLFSLIEFLMFDLDADGFVGVEEAVELFYRRYGREVLFKKEAVKGMVLDNSAAGAQGHLLSFHDFVKHDLAFYTISRQMADRAAYVAAKRKREREASTKDKEEPHQPVDTLANVPAVGTLPLALGGRSPRSRANSIVGGELHARLFDSGSRHTSLDAVDENGGSGPSPRARKLAQELGGGGKPPKSVTNNSLAKFAAMHDRASAGARGHLVTSNSSRTTLAGTAEAEDGEATERVPERITAKEALRKQEALKARRGSEVIYTYHGLSNAG